MAPRRAAVADTPLLMLEEELEIPAPPPEEEVRAAARTMPLPSSTQTLAVGAPNTPIPEAPEWNPVVSSVADPGALIDARLRVAQGKWSAEVVAVGEGGEILDEFAREGIVHAEGVRNPGWVLAGVDVLSELQRRALPGKLQFRIGDPQVVGFLVVTIRTRHQFAQWDQEAAAQPFPALYQEYLDLADRMKPRIIWDPKA